jgi:hypothetical protein
VSLADDKLIPSKQGVVKTPASLSPIGDELAGPAPFLPAIAPGVDSYPVDSIDE